MKESQLVEDVLLSNITLKNSIEEYLEKNPQFFVHSKDASSNSNPGSSLSF